MPQERRIKRRNRVSTQVFIESEHDKSRRRCATRNLSDGGAFIEIDEAPTFQAGEVVKLTFVVEIDGVCRMHQLTGDIARVEHDGIGVRLRRLDWKRRSTQSGSTEVISLPSRHLGRR